MDLDALQARFDEESEEVTVLRSTISKLNADLAAMKGKYERELIAKTEEYEEVRKKLTIRITELEDVSERERARASNLEKTKIKLMADIKDIQNELDNVSNFSVSLFKKSF